MPLAATDVVIPWWAFVLSTLAPWAALLVTLFLGLRDLKVKAKAEAVEADVKLLQAFGELAPVAAGRGSAFLSEKAAEKLVGPWDGQTDIDLRPALAQAPVDASQQAAILAAIAELAVRHALLKEPGRAMLDGLRGMAEGSNESVQKAYAAAVDRVESDDHRPL